MGDAYFEPSFPSSQGRAIEVLSVTDRFRLMLLLAWWLVDWPDQFVAICAMAKLTVTDLRSNFSNRPDWYEDVVGQVALGRFAGMKFASYSVISSNAEITICSTKDYAHKLCQWQSLTLYSICAEQLVILDL
jgi:hypothetical protein